MEKINHLTESNTNAIIQGISGIAGQIIQNKQAGRYVSGAENQVANLSQQTLAALGIAQAQQQQQQQQTPKGLSGTTMLLLGGGVLLLIVVVIMYKLK